MADDAKPKKGLGFLKAIFGGGIGLATGVVGVYATAIVDKVAKPPKPIANFSVDAPVGLSVTCQNQASGQTGWWDFGDGAALHPFSMDEKTVSHTYAKPGNFTVKLMVRNFLNEENDRSVAVDVSTPTKAGGGGPEVVSLSVKPVAGTVAPAMFRVTCELKNVKQVMLFSGQPSQKPELVSAASGNFTKDVVYEADGRYGLQLYAINGEAVDMKYAVVAVQPARPGVISAVAKITDSGSRVLTRENEMSIAIAVPQKATGPFERLLIPEAGYTFAELKIIAGNSKATKNLRIELAADKKSAKVTGEWLGSTDATLRATGGSDLMVQLAAVLVRPVAIAGGTQSRVGQLVFSGNIFNNDLFNSPLEATIALPPVPPGATTLNRTLTLELSEMADSVRVLLPNSTLDKPLGEVAVRLSNGQDRILRWEHDPRANVLRVSLRPGSRVASR